MSTNNHIHLSRILTLLLLCFLIGVPTWVMAQNGQQDPLWWQQQSLRHQQNGMLILGSWAGLNLLTGGLGYARTDGSRSYFHQMNAAWNTVNAGIAYFGYKGTLTNTSVTSAEILYDMNRFDTILLVNAGLDVLYISGGAWLAYRGYKLGKERWKGYGQAIILQGSFLMAFDLLLYASHTKLSKQLSSLQSEYLSWNWSLQPSQMHHPWIDHTYTIATGWSETLAHSLPVLQIQLLF